MTNKMMLSINKNMLTTDCLKSIYYVHIHSHLCYGLLAWGPMASKHAINELARIQDACVKLLSKKLNSNAAISMYRDHKLL